MATYRKRPVLIEAYQLAEGNWDKLHLWSGALIQTRFRDGERDKREHCLVIPTLEGEMLAEPGDWIVKGVKGEFYPVKDDIFQLTYEPVAGDV